MNINKLTTLFLSTACFLVSVSHATAETTTDTQTPPASQSTKTQEQAPGTVTTPAPASVAKSDQNAVEPLPAGSFQGDEMLFESKFRPQLGLGISILPAQGVWNRNWLSYFQAGLVGNIDVRVAERLSLRFSVGGIGSNSVDIFGSNISEFIASAELRVHLHKKPLHPNRLYVSPFLLVGALFNFATLGYSDGVYYTYAADYASYLGGMLGVGVEFRFGRSFAIDLDLRGTLQGGLRALSYKRDLFGRTFFDSYRGGVRFGVGASYYF